MGERFGDFELLARLDIGGMAEIFLARRVAPEPAHGPVVLKRILKEYSSRPELVRMFVEEGQVAARVIHPNVVRVFEVGRVGALEYIVMEHVDGLALSALSEAAVAAGEGGVPPALACRIFADLCRGLHQAHELTDAEGRSLGVVHRDIAPENVMVSFEGVTKLLDFGVAGTAEAGRQGDVETVRGRFAYLSPEAGQCLVIDRRSDLFSVGVCLWELVTGRRLWWRAGGQLATLAAVIEEEAPGASRYNPGVSPALEAVIGRALAKEPGHRYATALELALELEPLAMGEGPPEVAAYVQRVVAYATSSGQGRR